MSATNIQYPNISITTKEGGDIRNYLYQLVDELNFSLNDAIASGGNYNATPLHLYAKIDYVDTYIASAITGSIDYVDKSITSAILSSWEGSY